MNPFECVIYQIYASVNNIYVSFATDQVVSTDGSPFHQLLEQPERLAHMTLPAQPPGELEMVRTLQQQMGITTVNRCECGEIYGIGDCGMPNGAGQCMVLHCAKTFEAIRGKCV